MVFPPDLTLLSHSWVVAGRFWAAGVGWGIGLLVASDWKRPSLTTEAQLEVAPSVSSKARVPALRAAVIAFSQYCCLSVVK